MAHGTRPEQTDPVNQVSDEAVFESVRSMVAASLHRRQAIWPAVSIGRGGRPKPGSTGGLVDRGSDHEGDGVEAIWKCRGDPMKIVVAPQHDARCR